VPLMTTDRRWPAVSPSTVSRVVSAAEALIDKLVPEPHEMVDNTNRRALHRWLDVTTNAANRGNIPAHA